MNEKQDLKRLPTRLCVFVKSGFSNLDELEQWQPQTFYKSNPQLKIRPLVFDPTGDNDLLLQELRTRAEAHGAFEPFLIGDVMFADEIQELADEWAFAWNELKKMGESAANQLEQNEYLVWTRFKAAQAELAKQRAHVETARRLTGAVDTNDSNAELVAGDNQSSQELGEDRLGFLKMLESGITSAIMTELNPLRMQQIRDLSGDRNKLGVVLAEIFEAVARERAGEGGQTKNLVNNFAKQEALALAKMIWDAEPTLTKDAVTKRILKYLDDRFTVKSISAKTIAEWIVPAVPASKKTGGRPRKRRLVTEDE